MGRLPLSADSSVSCLPVSQRVPVQCETRRGSPGLASAAPHLVNMTI